MRTKIIALAIAITLALSTGLMLQANGKHNKKGKCNSKMPRLTQDMADKLNNLKSDFDSKLSPEDLTTLNQLRINFKQSRLETKSQVMDIRSSDITKDEKKAQIREIMNSINVGKEEIKVSIKTIIENNPEAVKSLANELKSLHKERKMKHSDNVEKEVCKGHKLTRFLLQDYFVVTDNNIKEIIKGSEKLDISINQDVLTFDSKNQSSNSVYTLYDITGNKISSLANQKLNEGENSLNLSSFNNSIEKGRYFLVVENENGLSAGKFIYIK